MAKSLQFKVDKIKTIEPLEAMQIYFWYLLKHNSYLIQNKNNDQINVIAAVSEQLCLHRKYTCL